MTDVLRWGLQSQGSYSRLPVTSQMARRPRPEPECEVNKDPGSGERWAVSLAWNLSASRQSLTFL